MKGLYSAVPFEMKRRMRVVCVSAVASVEGYAICPKQLYHGIQGDANSRAHMKADTEFEDLIRRKNRNRWGRIPACLCVRS